MEVDSLYFVEPYGIGIRTSVFGSLPDIPSR
jgi:hypothetical protein